MPPPWFEPLLSPKDAGYEDLRIPPLSLGGKLWGWAAAAAAASGGETSTTGSPANGPPPRLVPLAPPHTRGPGHTVRARLLWGSDPGAGGEWGGLSGRASPSHPATGFPAVAWLTNRRLETKARLKIIIIFIVIVIIKSKSELRIASA